MKQEWGSYTPADREQIANMLGPYDRGTVGLQNIGNTLSKIKLLFGYLNFAELEKIFRKKNFSTHLLAVPLENFSPDGQLICLDPNDLCLHLPYALVWCKNLGILQAEVARFHLDYDRQTNLECLRITGLAIPKEGTRLSQEMKGIRGLN